MCGIAGLYNLADQPIAAERVEGMCDLIRHRGLMIAACGHRDRLVSVIGG